MGVLRKTELRARCTGIFFVALQASFRPLGGLHILEAQDQPRLLASGLHVAAC